MAAEAMAGADAEEDIHTRFELLQLLAPSHHDHEYKTGVVPLPYHSVKEI